MDLWQLELELNELFEDAAEAPAIADITALWHQLEPMFSKLSVRDRLRLSSQIIDYLAGLHQAKAQWLLDEWENAHNPQDPALSADWLQGLVRQTQQLDLSKLTTPVQRRPRQASPKAKPPPETIVAEVPKATLLDLLDQVELEAEKAATLAVAHEENIQDWVAEIQQWFAQHPEPITLLQLRRELGWPLVQLWLSLLLGEFRLEANEALFYSCHIQVFAN